MIFPHSVRTALFNMRVALSRLNCELLWFFILLNLTLVTVLVIRSCMSTSLSFRPTGLLLLHCRLKKKISFNPFFFLHFYVWLNIFNGTLDVISDRDGKYGTLFAKVFLFVEVILVSGFLTVWINNRSLNRSRPLAPCPPLNLQFLSYLTSC